MKEEIVRLTEEEFVKVLESKGIREWDMQVALGGFKNGAVLDLDGKVKYVIKDI